MKTRTLLLALVVTGAGFVLRPEARGSGLPQPMCVYYGQARNGYGLPYLTNADVILFHGTNEIARQTIRGSLTPGVNFALYVHVDDGHAVSPYSPRALRSGDLVSIVVRDPQGQKTIMEDQAVPPVGQPGDFVAIDATAATDTDRDGLPDQWEQELIAWSGGRLQSLADVRPGDDFDGDGLSNMEEYRAGTFAFLNYDYLFVEQVGLTSDHLALGFLSVPGKVYAAEVATNLAEPAWAACPFSLLPGGSQAIAVEGNGAWMSLYLPLAESARYFRLVVK